MTDKPNIFQVQKERNFSLHHTLINAAHMALESAENKNPGYGLSQLTCITMSSLAIESMVNAFGERLIVNWNIHERAPTISKLLMIAGYLNLEVNFEEEIWRDTKWLYMLRNQIAHSQPQKVVEVQNTTMKQHLADFEQPKSKLEKKITLGNAQRAYRTAYDLRDTLGQALNIDDQAGLYLDSWNSFGIDGNDS
jgi:hypothetical protein